MTFPPAHFKHFSFRTQEKVESAKISGIISKLMPQLRVCWLEARLAIFALQRKKYGASVNSSLDDYKYGFVKTSPKPALDLSNFDPTFPKIRLWLKYLFDSVTICAPFHLYLRKWGQVEPQLVETFVEVKLYTFIFMNTCIVIILLTVLITDDFSFRTHPTSFFARFALSKCFFGSVKKHLYPKSENFSPTVSKSEFLALWVGGARRK